MNRFPHALFAVVLFCLFSCAGCSQVHAYDWRDPQWAKSPHLDQVQVIVLDARQGSGNPTSAASQADVENWTRDALQRIPGAVVISAAPDPAQPALGADTLCRVTIGHAGNRFSIGLPTLWEFSARLSYDIELIDIPTGELRFKAVRTITSGGEYNLLPLTDIPTLYQRDLAHVFAFATMREYPKYTKQIEGATTRPVP